MIFDKRNLAGAVLIVLLVMTCYYPAAQNGYIWDDDDHITRNSTLRSASGLYRIWFELRATPQYYPLVHTTFWCEQHLWGLNPRGYHIVNIFLHAVNALLLWFILRRLAVPGAWLAAALFAVHPVTVESVAWITERKNVLSAFFYFLAMIAYLRAAGLGPQPSSEEKGAGSVSFPPYILSLVLFIAALLSKTVTCSFPAAVLLITWWKRGRLRPHDFKPLLPFFIIGAGLGLQTAWIEKHGVGAQGDLFDYGSAERFLIAGRALWLYLQKIIWPQTLAFFYPRWTVDAGSAAQYVFPLAAAGLLAGSCLLHKKTGKGIPAALLFFAGTLFPALGFINVAPMRFSFVADHFQYLACIGPLTLGAAALYYLFQKIPRRVAFLKPVAIGALLALLGTLTWQQTRIYKNEETLWRDTLSKNPDSWIAHMNLGKTLFEQNKVDAAVACFQNALRIKAAIPMTQCHLGAALARRGDYAQALYHLLEAVRLYPEYGEAYYNLGILFAVQQKDAEAERYFLKSIEYIPDSAQTYYSLGLVLARQKKLPPAAFCFARAVELNPDNQDARSRLEKLRPYLNAQP